MSYQVQFSNSVLEGLREIVKKSFGPDDMASTVISTYGPNAVPVARQIAAETRGYQWLNQSRTPTAPLTVKEEDVADVIPEETSSVPISPLGRIKAHIASLEKRFHRDLVAFFKVIGSIALLFVVAVLWDKWSAYSAKRDREAEMQSVGTLATIAGSMFSAAYKECVLVGVPNIAECAVSEGILVQDMTAKTLAKAALDQRLAYDKVCMRYFSGEYCYQQLNRAFHISQRS